MSKYLSDCIISFEYAFKPFLIFRINILEQAQLRYTCLYNEKSINVSKKLEEILMNYEF